MAIFTIVEQCSRIVTRSVYDSDYHCNYEGGCLQLFYKEYAFGLKTRPAMTVKGQDYLCIFPILIHHVIAAEVVLTQFVSAAVDDRAPRRND